MTLSFSLTTAMVHVPLRVELVPRKALLDATIPLQRTKLRVARIVLNFM
jgi:hypothetical protein